MDKELYIDVILPVPVEHGFIYKFHDNSQDNSTYIKPEIGQRVLVPFGSRRLVGIIRQVSIDKPAYETKPIIEILDNEPCLSPSLMHLLEWASHYYFHPLGDVFKQFLPHRDVKLEANKFYRLSSHYDKNNDKENSVIKYLKNRKSVSRNTLIHKFGIATINNLVKTGCIEAVFKPVTIGSEKMDTIEKDNSQSPKPHNSETFLLTDEQRTIINQLIAYLSPRTFVTSLVMGVTGSGKTEIYMHVIEKALEQGRNAIVLVPEIALATQLVQRFIKRFGDVVGVVHSGKEPSSLKKTQKAILQGNIRIVIGVRSALFAPVKNVGVIVVDEEHAHTYKQEDRFRYNARDAAIMRGKHEQAIVILGSATPSLESYYNASTGKYRFYRLYNRVNKLPMPDMHVIDLRKEHPHKIGNEILTQPLVDALTKVFSHGKQAIIMLNKRGYSSSLICTDCGYTPRCPECDIPFTYHKASQRLVCHYCGYSITPLQKCPECGSASIKPLGIGTQRLEEEIKKLFKSIKFVRMDSDTTMTTGSHERLINMFGSGEALILLGTQMVAKGLDFPDVELVCLPLLDVGLNVPDFRSAERTFDIITQSAGRAGRISSGAHVFLQTYNPDYYAVRYAVRYDTDAFYKEELKYRKELSYPPFSRIALFIFRHKNNSRLQDVMNKISKEVSVIPQDILVSGPVPAPMSKIKNFYVYHLLLRSPDTQKLLNTVHRLNTRFKPELHDVQMNIDVDPQYFV